MSNFSFPVQFYWILYFIPNISPRIVGGNNQNKTRCTHQFFGIFFPNDHNLHNFSCHSFLCIPPLSTIFCRSRHLFNYFFYHHALALFSNAYESKTFKIIIIIIIIIIIMIIIIIITIIIIIIKVLLST